MVDSSLILFLKRRIKALFFLINDCFCWRVTRLLGTHAPFLRRRIFPSTSKRIFLLWNSNCLYRTFRMSLHRTICLWSSFKLAQISLNGNFIVGIKQGRKNGRELSWMLWILLFLILTTYPFRSHSNSLKITIKNNRTQMLQLYLTHSWQLSLSQTLTMFLLLVAQIRQTSHPCYSLWIFLISLKDRQIRYHFRLM